MAAHTTSNKLEDQAATAALYVTRSTTSAGFTGSTYLDEDGKLSSAGAAASLKYAQPADLPSYPSQGGVKLSSAGAAASLAHANQKTFVPWKPGEIPGANKAAFLAKDYQAPPVWRPEMSSAGSRAALQAARDGANVNISTPDETEEGANAAGHAMRRTDLSPNIFRGVDADGRDRAMMAATGAMSSGRRRAESSPITTSSPNAISAATSSQRGPRRGQAPIEVSDPAVDHARIHNIAKNNVSRQMYTTNPPVNIEVEEKNRKDTLHASAVAMAQQMYKVQQARIEQAAAIPRSDSHYAATHVHGRRESTASSTTDDLSSPPQYTNLHEAAQKLATERLAKIHDEHAAYRNYYHPQVSPPRKRLSIRPKARRRASSDSDAARLDEEQSQKIRSEMSLFQDKLAQVDSKKRQKDRDALMAAAQRNVTARMSTMDDKVFADTGKASPAMVSEWEASAQARAQADSNARMVNHGRIHIGSGKYLDQADVDAIARARLQPTLDEITEKAETQRARDEELRLEEEEKKRQAELEKVRSAELNAEQKKQLDVEKAEAKAKKDFEKSQLAEEKRVQKEAERAEKQALKEKEAEEKRIAKEEADEKRKSKEAAARVEAEEKRKSKEAAAKEATDKETKRKGGLFGVFSLGTGAGAAAGAAVAAIPPTLDPIPHTEPIATTEAETAYPEPITTTEGETVTEKEAKKEATEDSEDKGKEKESGGLLQFLHQEREGEPKAETAEAAPEEPSSPVSPVAQAEEKAAETTSAPPPPVITTTGTGESATSPTNEETPVSPTKSGVKGWLKGKFARRSSRSAKDEPGFIGGAALTGPGIKDEETNAGPSSPGLIPEEDSMKEVAMAGKSLAVEQPDAGLYSASEYEEDVPPEKKPEPEPESLKKSPSISSMSSAGPADDTKDRVSPIDVSEPSSPAQALVSPSSPEPTTSPTSPTTKPRGRDRFGSFLSKGKGLGRRLSKSQKKPSESAPPAESSAVAGGTDDTALNKESSEHLEKKITEESGKEATKTKSKESKENDEPDFEEARDKFDAEENLPPPPKITEIISENGGGLGRKASGSPVRDSRFSEDL